MSLIFFTFINFKIPIYLTPKIKIWFPNKLAENANLPLKMLLFTKLLYLNSKQYSNFMFINQMKICQWLVVFNLIPLLSTYIYLAIW